MITCNFNFVTKNVFVSNCFFIFIFLTPYILVCVGLGLGVVRAVQAGARLRAGLMGCGGVVGAICCVMVIRKLSDYKVAWEEVRRQRSQYRQLSIHLDALMETVEKDLKEGVQLIGMIGLEWAIIVSVTAFLAYIAYICFYYHTERIGTPLT